MKKTDKIQSERVLAAAREFISMTGPYEDIETTLWDMLYGSTTKPDLPTDHRQNDSMMFLYRRLTEFLKAIQPIEPPKVRDFCKN